MQDCYFCNGGGLEKSNLVILGSESSLGSSWNLLLHVLGRMRRKHELLFAGLNVQEILVCLKENTEYILGLIFHHFKGPFMYLLFPEMRDVGNPGYVLGLSSCNIS